MTDINKDLRAILAPITTDWRSVSIAYAEETVLDAGLDEKLREVLKPYLIVAKNSNLPDFKLYDEEWLNQVIAKIKALVVEQLPQERKNALKPGGIVLSEDGKTVDISKLTQASNGGFNQCLGRLGVYSVNKDFEFSEDYASRTVAEQIMLDALAEMLFIVQYARRGDKTRARRAAAFEIVDSIKNAYKINRVKKD